MILAFAAHERALSDCPEDLGGKRIRDHRGRNPIPDPQRDVHRDERRLGREIASAAKRIDQPGPIRCATAIARLLGEESITWSCGTKNVENRSLRTDIGLRREIIVLLVIPSNRTMELIPHHPGSGLGSPNRNHNI